MEMMRIMGRAYGRGFEAEKVEKYQVSVPVEKYQVSVPTSLLK
jgi:hypothetical protein